MKTIPWGTLDPAEVERLIAALLVRTVPDAYAVDGAGGDDGADVVAPLAAGIHVYEIKSFTKRLTSGQRRQVEESLATASKQRPNMAAWTLVLPLDISPAEERWLEQTLAPLAGVPVAWMGRTQLEAAFAEHPHLARAFLPGSAQEEALQQLAAYGHEQAAMARGVPDAVDRGTKLRQALRLVDPDFDFDLALGAQQTVVHILPRDEQALIRRPIQTSVNLSAPMGSAEAAAIEDFALYGSPLELGPSNIVEASVLGLPGGLDVLFTDAIPQQLSIGPGATEPRRGRLIGLTDPAVVARLPVTVIQTSQGPAGGMRLILRDDPGVLRAELRIRPDRRSGNVNLSLGTSGAYPDDALPAARFLAALSGCDRLRLETHDLPPATVQLPDTSPIDRLGATNLVHTLEALHRLQHAADVSFTVPTKLTSSERRMLDFVDRLVQGQTASWTWPGMLTTVPAKTARDVLASATLPRVTVTGRGPAPLTFSLAGHTCRLPGSLHMTATNAVVMNVLAVFRQLSEPHCTDDHPVVLDLEDDDRTTIDFALAAPPPEPDHP